MEQDARQFGQFHPIINGVYFLAVLIFAMFFLHPLLQGIAAACVLCYLVILKGLRQMLSTALFLLPVVAVTAILNPVLNDAGTTVLATLPGGKHLTKEAFLYGISSGVMLATVICWFACLHQLMTSDKLMYLFGKLLPSLSLVFSMTLRFVPRFRVQLSAVLAAQKNIGRGVQRGSVFNRLKQGIAILSMMITWSFEHALDTADSMRSRGYGLGGRTSFSPFRFTARDRSTLLFLVVLIVWIAVTFCVGGFGISFFPTIQLKRLGVWGVMGAFAYFLLCALPLITELVEVIRWKQ